MALITAVMMRSSDCTKANANERSATGLGRANERFDFLQTYDFIESVGEELNREVLNREEKFAG